MRKTYLVVMLTAISSLVFGQTSNVKNETAVKNHNSFQKANSNKSYIAEGNGSSRGSFNGGWISVADALAGDEIGIDPSFTYPVMMPDTNTVFLFSTGETAPVHQTSWDFLFTAGQVFSPNTEIFREGYDDNASFGPGAKAVLDSMRIYYLYTRYTDSTVSDTLRIQIIKNPGNYKNGFLDADGNPSGLFYGLPYDTASNMTEQNRVLQTIDFVLTDDDTSGNFLGTKTIDLGGIDLSANGYDDVFTYTMNYLPGNNYAFGDTIGEATASHKINVFRACTFEEEESSPMYSQENSDWETTGEYDFNIMLFSFPGHRYKQMSWSADYFAYDNYLNPGFFIDEGIYEQLLTDYHISVKAADFSASISGRDVQFLDESNFTVATSKFKLGEEDQDGQELQKFGVNQIASHTYTLPGTYTVTLESKEAVTNDTYTFSKNITVNWGVGISELSEGMNTRLFPNPASTNLNIEVNVANAANMNVQVIDALGKVVFEDNAVTAKYNRNLSVANFAAGTYQVRVVAGEETMTSNLVIK